MANDYLSPKFGNVVKLTFVYKDLPPGSSNQDLHYSDIGTASCACPMLADGYVVGLAAVVSGSSGTNTLTAGSATFSVHEASTEVGALGAVKVDTSGSGGGTMGYTNYKTYEPGAYEFSAGDLLGVSVTTTTTTALTGGAASNGSPVVVADLYVVYKPT
jgi:hypothetical protein